MDFSEVYRLSAAAAGAPLHFAPHGRLLAHAVGGRVVLRDADSLSIVRVWEPGWKAVDALAFAPAGDLLLAANFRAGDVRVVCADEDLEAALLDGVGNVADNGWECRIDNGAPIVGVRWGGDGESVWCWEDFNLRLAVHSLTTLSTAYLANPKHGPERGVSFHPLVPTRALVLERRDCKDTVAIYSSESAPAGRDSRAASVRSSRTGARGSMSVAPTSAPAPEDPFPLRPIHRFDLLGPSTSASPGPGSGMLHPLHDAHDAQWSPDGRFVLAHDSPLSYAVHAYTPDGRCVWSYSPPRHPSDLPLGVRALRWERAGRYLALGGFDGRVRIVDSWGWRNVAGWCGEIGAVETADVECWKEVDGKGGRARFEKVAARPFPIPIQRGDPGVVSAALPAQDKGDKGPIGLPKTGISVLEWSCDGEWIVTRNETTPCTLLIHHVPTLTLHSVLQCRSAPVRPHFSPNPPTALAWASTSNTALYTWDPRFGPESWEIPAGPEGFRVRGVRWNGAGGGIAVWENPGPGEKGGRWCVGFPVDGEANATPDADAEEAATEAGEAVSPPGSHYGTPGPAIADPEGIEHSMDRLTVAAGRRGGTPAHGLLGRRFDDEDEGSPLGSAASSEPAGTPTNPFAGATPARLGGLGFGRGVGDREIRTDEAEAFAGLGRKMAALRSDSTLWSGSRELDDF
ncbi:hypothetical protein DFJ74DRAFT_732057 [Hyaloraphidium curvatum]|nr:hypothetical protein DFJ74DRAFT_732057 [Hyaloraphidium curvatum]